jgi:hypothetical protein
MPLRGIPMMFGGVLMGFTDPVPGKHGRLLVCRRRSSMCLARSEMLVGGRLVRQLGAPKRVVGALPGSGDGVRVRWHATGQLIAPHAELVGAGTRPFGAS